MAPAYLPSKRAISFWTKGDVKSYHVMLFAKSKGSMPIVKSFTSGPDWEPVPFPLSDFETDARDPQGLMIAALAVPGRFRVLIDYIGIEQ